MTRNTKHEDSVGKEIETTLLNIQLLDKDALDRKYDFLEVENEGERERAVIISDPGDEISGGRICGTCADHKKRYIMLRKDPKNFQVFREYLDGKGDCFRLSALSSKDVPVKALLNLLINSFCHELNDWSSYNNLDGYLYIWYPPWRLKRTITALKVEIEKHTLGYTLNLSATRFNMVSGFKSEEAKKKIAGKPQYVLSDDGCLHRSFDNLPSNYVNKPYGNERGKVPYYDPSNVDSFKLSKNYIIDQVIDRLNEAFEGCLKVSKHKMKIDVHLDLDPAEVQAFREEMDTKVAKSEFNLINTVNDDKDGERLESAVVRAINARLKKDVSKSDFPVKDKFNIRIIHNDEYYDKYKIQDEYRKFPGYVVQHLTVEKCNPGDKSEVNSNIMGVLVKELFIKDCIDRGEDLVGDWQHRGFDGDVIFYKRVLDKKSKTKLYKVFKLTMHPDAKFELDTLDCNDPFLLETMKGIWSESGWYSDTEYAIEYKGSVCTIQNSGAIPVVNNDIILQSIVNKTSENVKVTDGLGPRGYKTYNNTLYSITDVQLLSFGSDLLYVCGDNGNNMKRKYDKAPNIRLVRSVKGTNFFSVILSLMNVPFVRHGQNTVFPYPFKFMTEYIEEQTKNKG